jgi:hypothetical protein
LLFECSIVGELLLHAPLLPGQTELEQLRLMCALLGSPSEVPFCVAFRFVSLRFVRAIDLSVALTNLCSTLIE